MENNPDIFVDLILAGMKDAAVERKLTQILTQIPHPKTGKPVRVRLIIVPETMDIEWPQGLGKN